MNEYLHNVGLYTPGVLNRVMSYQIDIFKVTYDEEGNKIDDEGEIGSEESEPECFKGIFNGDLLDSEYLNQ
jgi:hypothetical protein